MMERKGGSTLKFEEQMNSGMYRFVKHHCWNRIRF